MIEAIQFHIGKSIGNSLYLATARLSTAGNSEFRLNAIGLGTRVGWDSIPTVLSRLTAADERKRRKKVGMESQPTSRRRPDSIKRHFEPCR